MGSVASRTSGEGGGKIFRSPEGMRLSPKAMPSGGKADAFNLGGGPGVDGSEAERCIACVVTKLSELGGILRLSVVI